MKFLVINGPNINMLGIREPEIYGSVTFVQLLKMIDEYALENNVEIKQFQSNHEGAIVDEIQAAYNKFDGIVINPAAYTHTSIAIYDALMSVGIPTIEVHISSPDTREAFRHHSFTAKACKSVISGKGVKGYIQALEMLKDFC